MRHLGSYAANVASGYSVVGWVKLRIRTHPLGIKQMKVKRKREPKTSQVDASLEQVLAALAPALVRVVSAPAGLDVPAPGVVVHDHYAPAPFSRGAIVLGVGLAPGKDLSALMEELAGDGCILVLKSAGPVDAELAAEAERLGLTLLAAPRGAAWMQVASLLRSAINDDAAAREGEVLGGVAAGDLFAVANAVSALVDAPVTIEDPESRVIAYSNRQDEADDARIATILGRQVPDEFFRQLQKDGVFRHLYRDRAPMTPPTAVPGVQPRLAVAVKAGGELLRSVGAAGKSQPPQPQLNEFRPAANFVAPPPPRNRLAPDGHTAPHTA